MGKHRWAQAIAGVLAVALVPSTPPISAEFTSSSFVADATAVAVRGERFQLTPSPGPPSASFPPVPPPAGCTPGALVRGVNTGGARVVAFSYDDGPWPVYTRGVMDAFEARGLRATFFWIGSNVATNPDIARDVVARGHEVGNHSMTHVYSPSTIAREIPVANSTIQRITGVRPSLFRSPGLTEGGVIQSTLAANGMCNIFTTVELGDWYMPRRTASRLCSAFANTLHPGEIALLHDGGTHAQTVAATPCMLDVALQRGYRIVTVGGLLQLGTPYSSGYGGRA